MLESRLPPMAPVFVPPTTPATVAPLLVLMPQTTPATMAPPMRRRASVPGDDVDAIKSPKLEAQDTSVQTTSGSSLYDFPSDDSPSTHGPHPTPAARTSSKRYATQPPSPSAFFLPELPNKIAKLGLGHGDNDPASSSFESLDQTFESALTFPSEKSLAGALPSSCLTFCALPRELRLQIYLQLPDLVLPHPLIYCISPFGNNKQHPLASVNQLIRSEALDIFYSYNTWVLKLEFDLMYDSFRNWVIRVGDYAGCLRKVHIAVRGTIFKPAVRLWQPSRALPNTTAREAQVSAYHLPDGEASFSIDLSEKFTNGKVTLLRNDGSRLAGEWAHVRLRSRVRELWAKRRAGTLNGQDWVNMVDKFLKEVGSSNRP